MGKGSSPDIEETAEQKELAAIAAEQWQYSQTELAPVRDMFIKENLAANDSSKFEQLTGSVKADTGMILEDQLNSGAEQLKASGVDPTSGKFQGTMDEMTSKAATITADNVNRSQVVQQDNYLKGLSNVVAMGEKKAMDAQQGLSDVAADSAAYATDSALRSSQRRGDNQQALGFGLGVAYDSLENKRG